MKNDDVEKMLLNSASLDELIKMKIEQEFKNDLQKSREKPKQKTVTDIKDVPYDKIFSEHSIFRFFNRDSKCETFVNGIQADALLGLQNLVRERVLKGELSSFTTDNAYVKFEKAVF